MSNQTERNAYDPHPEYTYSINTVTPPLAIISSYPHAADSSLPVPISTAQPSARPKRARKSATTATGDVKPPAEKKKRASRAKAKPVVPVDPGSTVDLKPGEGLCHQDYSSLLPVVTNERVTSASASSSAGPKIGQETRMGRVRAKCPQNTYQRSRLLTLLITRADPATVMRVMTQRMFLVDREKVENDPTAVEIFKVLGSTGNVYTVTIGRMPHCDCPDCSIKHNVPCKHIMFVFLKVLKVSEASSIWYQKYLLASELDLVFAAAPVTPCASTSVSDQLRLNYLRATGAADPAAEAEIAELEEKSGPGKKKLDSIGEDCPVCYEEMSAADQSAGKLIYDEALAGCGKPLHNECFAMWKATAVRSLIASSTCVSLIGVIQVNKGDTVTCVWCRAPWPMEGPAGKGKGKAQDIGNGMQIVNGGYINMAAAAGMSGKRDLRLVCAPPGKKKEEKLKSDSTYYQGPVRGGKPWESRYEDN
ncbi:hypothetical protein P7C73_g358, partial [Tremellales sp. Uapishka_1]